MRAYEITFKRNHKVETQVVKTEYFYQDARESLKAQFKNKIEILGWKRAYEHEVNPH